MNEKEPIEMVGWDLMGPFPVSLQGNKYILVITEYLTHWCKAVALPDSTPSTVVRAYCNTSPWVSTTTPFG